MFTAVDAFFEEIVKTQGQELIVEEVHMTNADFETNDAFQAQFKF